MNHLRYFLFILFLGQTFSSFSQNSYLTLRRISPNVAKLGDSITMTLKVPRQFDIQNQTSSSLLYFIPQTNTTTGFLTPAKKSTSLGFQYEPLNRPSWTNNYVRINRTMIKANDSTNVFWFRVPNNIPTGNYDIKIDIDPFNNNAPSVLYKNAFFIEGSIAKVSGNVFYDSNGNGTKDSQENSIPYRGVKAISINNSQSIYTDQNGNYTFYLNAGTYTIQPSMALLEGITTGNNVLSLLSTTNISNFNVGLRCTAASTITASFGSSRFRCNTTGTGYISFTNNGCSDASGTIKLLKPTTLTCYNFNPSPSQVNGDTLIWNVSNTKPFSWNLIYFNIVFPSENFTGVNLNFDLWTYTNNITTFTKINGPVRCSYDPNDITLYSENKVNPDSISLQTNPLTYQINFENYGNDTAFVVKIRDTLDANLDLKTIKVIGNSHNFKLSTNENINSLEFVFDNAKLTARAENPIKSTGFVKFSIQKKIIQAGTVIQGNASIYFDFNPAVKTNTNRTTVANRPTYNSDENMDKDVDLVVFPNPSSDILYFKSDKHKIQNIEIYDSNGKTVLTLNNILTSTLMLPIVDFGNGTYIYKIQLKDGKTIDGLIIKK